MADHDKTLEILIRIKAEISEIQRARAELVEMKRQATAMGVSTGDLDAQIGKLDSEIGRLGRKSVPDATEGMQLFNVHTRETHRLIHELSRVSPEAGNIMRAVFHPQALGIIGVVIALQSVVEWIGEYQKKLQALKDAQDEITVNIWENMRESASSVAKSAADYADAIENAGKNLDPLKTKQEAEKKILDAQIEAHKKLVELMEKEAIATLPPGHSKDDEDAIHKRFATKNQEFGLTAEKENIEQLEKFRRENAEKSVALKRIADNAERQKEASENDKQADKDAARLGVLNSKQLELQKATDPKKLEELKRDLAVAQQVADSTSDPQGKTGALMNVGILASRIKPLEEAQQALDDNQKEIEDLTAKQRAYGIALDKLTKAADRTLADYTKSKDADTAFGNQIDAARGVYGVHVQSVGEQQAKQQGIDFAPRARSLIEQAEEIAGRGKGTYGLKKPELEFLGMVGSQIAGRSLTPAEADKMFEGDKGDNNRTQQFIERLLKAVENIPATVLPAYEQRLNGIEQSLRNVISRSRVPPGVG